MPNPRYFNYGKATPELVGKLAIAKKVYFENLDNFCEKYCIELEPFRDITSVFLIGSHAEDTAWSNETSDLDLKLVNPSAVPDYLRVYKQKILDPKLHLGDKPHWIDLFFARELYQVLPPRWELTKEWNSLK
jgi:predicted nucleotidyltransferase